MLPFDQKKEGSVSIVPDIIKRKPDEEQDYDVMESAAEDLCHAIAAKDYKGIAMALRAAFELHKEGHNE